MAPRDGDGLGMAPRPGEPESALIPGMAAPTPPAPQIGSVKRFGLFGHVQLGSMPDTSGPGPTALETPNVWNYDFDPATGNARAQFPGIVLINGAPVVTGGVASFNTRTGAVTLTSADVLAVVPALSLVIRIQTFAASGTYTPNANMVGAIIEGVGGGGGGASLVSAASTGFYAGGGGAGGYSRKAVTRAQVGASQVVTIGAGGAGSTSGSVATAGNGGDTSVGALMIAKGGTGGATIPGAGSYDVGGAGGVVGTGDVSMPGEKGGPAAQFTNASFVGAAGGWGGSSQWSGRATTAPATAAPVAGTAGIANSGSGGGAAYCLNTSNAAGGAGGTGFVVVTEFCSS